MPPTARDSLRVEVLVFLGLALAATVWIAYHIQDLGFRIGQPSIGLDYAMGVFWWTVLAVGLVWFGGEDRKLLLLGWVAKFFVVLVAMLFYEQQYGLDAYWYFKVTVTGEHPHYSGVDWRKEWYLFQDPLKGIEPHRLGQGTDNMIRLVMFLSMFVGKYYHPMKVIVAFVGLLGSWAFYRAIVVILGRPVPAAFYWLTFFPSVLFWSSILGKDPLIFMVLGLVAYGGARMLIRGELIGSGIAAVGLVMAFNIRPWTALMVACGLGLAVLIRRGYVMQRMAIVAVLVPALLVAWEPIKLRFHIDDLKSFEKLYVQLTEGQDVKSEWTAYTAEFGGSRRASGALEVAQQIQSGDLTGVLPVVIFSGLFRPLPWDARNIFSGFAAVENTALLVLVLMALWRLKWSTARDAVVVWAVSYSLLWAALHGAILIANFGTGIRYKLQVLPFMIIVLFLLLHPAGYAQGRAQPLAIAQGDPGWRPGSLRTPTA